MECIIFMHQHQHLLNSGMTHFGLPRELKQVWHAFMQESIRTVAPSSKSNLQMADGLAIAEVTKQAFIQLGENGVIHSAEITSVLSVHMSIKLLLTGSLVMIQLEYLELMKIIKFLFSQERMQD